MIDDCLVVEFAVTGDDCPLAQATAEVSARISCRPPQYRADGTTLLQFHVGEGGEALASALDADERIAYLHVSHTDAGYSFRCLSKHPCVAHTLVDTGFLAESMDYRDGAGIFRGAVVGHEVLRNVLSAAGDAIGVRLRRAYPLEPDSDSAEVTARQWDITPAQEEALRTAAEMGYFEVPRGTDAAGVAGELDISKSAFLERLHRGQNRVFAGIFSHAD